MSKFKYYKKHQRRDFMQLSSSAFDEGGWIPKKYSARGEDLSPALHIEDLPKGTKSLMITMDDSSHPLFPNYNHWIIWNIPVIHDIPEALPKGERIGLLSDAMQGIAYGKHCYKGPKPPFKTIHYYVFTVYALSDVVNMPTTSKKGDLLKQVEGMILGKATLTGKFQSRRQE